MKALAAITGLVCASSAIRGTSANSRDLGLAQRLQEAQATVCNYANQRAHAVLGVATELSALAVSGRAGLAQRSRRSGGGSESGCRRYSAADIARVTDRVVDSVVDVIRADGWEHVTTQQGVCVWRNRMATAGGEQFACIKAAAVIDAPVDVVYSLFADNARVHEYNEHCRELADIEVLDSRTKVTWAASGRMGPFKARDFCSLVHMRTLADGTRAQVSRPARHRGAPPTDRFVRSEVLLAGNFMRPLRSDPSKTEFLCLTQVNPGGAADSRAGAMLVNNLAASGPVAFVRKLEAAAQRVMREEGGHRHRSSSPYGSVRPSPLEDREAMRHLPVV